MPINGIENVDLQNDDQADGITKINTSMTAITNHDHSGDKGDRITTSAITIDANLEMNGFSLNDIGELILNAMDLASTNNLGLYTKSVNSIREVFFKDSSGQEVQLSNNGTVNFAGSGSLSGVFGSAAVTYNNLNKRWTLTDGDGNNSDLQIGNEFRMENGGFITSVVSAATQASTITLPDETATLAITSDIDTQVSKTYTTPNIASPAFSGTATGSLSELGLTNPAFSGTPTGSLTDLQVIEPVNTVTPVTLTPPYTSTVDAMDLANWTVNTATASGVTQIPGSIALDTGSETVGTNSYLLTVDADPSTAFNRRCFISSPDITIPALGTYTFSLTSKETGTATAGSLIICKDNDTSNAQGFVSLSFPSVPTVITTPAVILSPGTYNVILDLSGNTAERQGFIGGMSLVTTNLQMATIDFDKAVNKVTVSTDTAIFSENKTAGKSTKLILENGANAATFVTSSLGARNVSVGSFDGYLPTTRAGLVLGITSYEIYFDGTVDNVYNLSNRGDVRPQTITSSSVDEQLKINSQTSFISVDMSGSSDETPTFNLDYMTPGQQLTIKLISGTITGLSLMYGGALIYGAFAVPSGTHYINIGFYSAGFGYLGLIDVHTSIV